LTIVILHLQIRLIGSLLLQFSAAMGLVINFHKSTIVQLPPTISLPSKRFLGCRVERFPQIYLGLQLSAEKLTLATFSLLIALLINSVLDALANYAMHIAFLPPALLHILEGLPRDFLWNALDHPSGAKCLVAWQQVCLSKEEGRLCICCLFKQNRSQQVKLLHTGARTAFCRG
jgi:hypothetical protein